MERLALRSSSRITLLPNRAFVGMRRRAAMAAGVSVIGLALSAPAFADPSAGALPTGGQVASGQVSISSSGSTMTVNQASQRGIVNWQGFDIGSDAAVNFVQPSANAVTLNRVVSGGGSTIAGKLSANGKVYVVNPAGILFTPTAQVNVGGLVAAAGSITNADFLAGNDRFALTGSGTVVNQGLITARDGGSVVLAGSSVTNQGVINARSGDVVLAAGAGMTLAAGADGHLSVAVDGTTTQALVENGGLIAANGGQVLLTAEGASAAVSSIVSNTGTIEAETLANKSGKILLLAGMESGVVRAGGTLDASAPTDGDGGFIETSAASVAFAPDLRISTLAATGNTGTWLIDPYNITISSAGSSGILTDATGNPWIVEPTGSGANILNTTLSSYLAASNVAIKTAGPGSEAGNIYVNAPVSWSTGTSLSLIADGAIFVNSSINGSNGASALNLSSNGLITQTSGSIAIGTLTANALGSISLTQASNQIATLGGVTAGGSFALTNSSGLSLTGPIAIGGTLTLSAGGSINQVAGTINTYDALSVSTSSGSVSLTQSGNQIRTLGAASIEGSLALTTSTGLLLTGSVSASQLALTASSTILQAGGAINANTVSAVSSNGAINLGQAGNQFSTLAGLTAAGSVSANSAGALTVNGPIATGTGQVFLSSGGNLTIATALTDNLGNANYRLQSGGLLTIGKDLTLTGSNALLSINASNGYTLGSSHITLSGLSSSFDANGQAYTLIHDISQLQAVSASGYYALGNDIDASTTASWNGGAGFAPLTNFQGVFAGLGHAIDRLTINRPSQTETGLFAAANSATLRDFTLSNASVTGAARTGIVGGNIDSSTINNVHVTGAVAAFQEVGGIAGWLSDSTLSGVSSAASVSAVQNSAGGLVGRAYFSDSIVNSYAVGAVTGSSGVAGLIGEVGDGSTLTLTSVYASGRVTGSSATGGLVGLLGAGSSTNVSGALWDVGSTGQPTSRVGIGFVPSLAYDQALYSSFGFDLTNTWIMVPGETRPMLRNEASSVIFTPHALQLMALNLGGSYALGTDIDLTSAYSLNGGYYGDVWGQAGFGPIGDGSAAFTGSFDGQGHTIKGLVINRTGAYNVGLFGNTTGAAISNLVLAGGHVIGGTFTGSLIGTMSGGSLAFVQSNLDVNGDSYVGGLIGNLAGGSIDAASASGAVTGAADLVGGLAGSASGTIITRSYTSGNVTGAIWVGGLVGYNIATISDSYAAGNVTGTSPVGGLVGINFGSITNTYASGAVSSTGVSGGLVGQNGGIVASSYWDTTNSGLLVGIGLGLQLGATGLTTAGMRSLASYGSQGWNIDDAAGTGAVWRIYDGSTTPLLRAFLTPLTVTAGSVTKVYDGTTAVAAGQLTYGSTYDASKILGTAAFQTSSANVGTYNTALAGLYSGQNGYDLNVVSSGTITITRGSLLVRASDAAKTYNGAGYVGGNGVVYTGFVAGESAANLGGTLTYSGSSQGATGVGSYSLIASGLTSSNYAITYVNGTLTVSPAPLTISAGNLFKTYDGLVYQGLLPYTVTGLIGGDTLSGAVVLAGAGATAVNAGSYGITLSGLTASNYAITYVPGTLAINPAALTVRVNNASKVYDGLAYAGGNGVTYDGFVGSEGASVLGGSLVYGSSAQGALNAGTYGLSASGLTSNNYAITYVDGSLNIGRALLTATLSNVSKTYDGQAFAGGNGASFSGFVGSDDASDLGGALAYGGTSQGAVNAGSYGLAGSGLTSANYDIHYVDGALSVTPASLLVSVNDARRTYSGSAWSGGNGVSYSGFVGGDDASVLGGSLTWGGSAQGAINAGLYGLSARGLSSGNYAITYSDGTLTIDPAALTVHVLNAGKTYDGKTFSGGAGVAFDGFVGSDGASDLSGTLVYGGSAQGAVGAGTYGLTTSGLSSNNYSISYVAGDLVIGRAALTVTANNDLKTYDGRAFTGGTGVTFEGLAGTDSAADLGGTLAYGGSAQGARNAGTYELTAGGFSSDNYAITYRSGSLTIDPARLSIVANSVTIPSYGSYLPLTYTVSGLAAGDTAETVLTGALISAADVRRAGTYAIEQGSLGVASANYVLGDFTPGAVVVEGRAADGTPNGGALRVSLAAEGVLGIGTANGGVVSVGSPIPHAGGLAAGHLGFEGNFIP